MTALYVAMAIATAFGGLFGFFAGLSTLPKAKKLKPWQIDPNQPCPACGHTVGSIKFDETIKEIRHRCSVCEATWGEPTVVKVDDWRKKTPQPEVPFQWG